MKLKERNEEEMHNDLMPFGFLDDGDDGESFMMDNEQWVVVNRM